MCEEFLNEIENEKKNINEEIYRNFFKYQNPSSLVEELIREDKNKTDKIKFQIMNELIKMEDINKKEISENENSKKGVNLLKKSLILINSEKL